MPTPIITDTPSLQALVEKHENDKVVALDTEFVWTKTYYPNLGLLQAGWSEHEVKLIDPIEISDLAPLKAFFADGSIVKIFHDPEMDIPILQRAVGIYPTNVFDTKLAAGFAGLGASSSLGGLIETFFGVVLPKSQTRTNWCKRPLTEKQIDYALDDVRYMPELYRKLLKKVDECGNRKWMEEEMSCWEHGERIGPSDPREMFRSVKSMGQLPPAELAILRELAEWRELRAREDNLPRKRVVSDEALIKLCKGKPTTTQKVQNYNAIARRTVANYADQIAELIDRAKKIPKSDYPRLSGALLDAKTLKRHADEILKQIRKAAEPRHIDPILVGARRDANSLAQKTAAGKQAEHKLLRGWRAELLDGSLEPILASIVPTRRTRNNT